MQEMKETQVQSLGLEDPLEKGMTTHSNVLPQWTEEPGGVQSIWSQSQTRLKRLSMHTHSSLGIWCWWLGTR